VTIDNFLVIGHAEVFLRDQGTVLVLGDDQDGGRSDSNGVGKSSIFEAICWCLYGQTYQGLKHDDVVSYSSPGGTRVEVDLLIGKDEFTVVRYRKHKKGKNKLEIFLRGKRKTPFKQTDAEALLRSIIPLSFTAFKHVAYFGQGMSDRFLSMTDMSRKKLLEELLELDVFSDAEKVVKGRLKDLIGSLNVIDGKKQVLQATIDDCEKRLDELSESGVREMRKIEDGKRKALEKLKKLKQGKEDLLKRLKKEESLEDKLKTSLKKELGNWEEACDKCEEITTTYLRLKSKVDMYKEQTERFEAMGGKICSECEQEVEPGHLSNKLTKLEEKLRKTEEKLGEVSSLLAAANDARKTISKKIDDIKKRLHPSKVTSVAMEINRVSGIMAMAKGEVRLLKQRQQSLKAPMETLGKTIEESESKLQKELDREAEIASELPYMEYWAKGFSTTGIRSMILDDVIDYLNTRMAHHSRVISDGEISISLSPQTRLKSGDLREKMSVTASTGGAGYKAASGGQRRRMDLAVHFALSDMTSMITGHRTNILICDEVFDCVDETGVEAIMSVLREKAKTTSVFLVSHSDSLKDMVDDVLLVTRNSGVSTVRRLA
jgi:DNA repair exonuclease SbcCD ATPase subunit